MAFRQQPDALRVELHLVHVVYQDLVHAFQANGTSLQKLRDTFSRFVNIGIPKNQQAAMFGPVHQADFRTQNHNAGALRAHQ